MLPERRHRAQPAAAGLCRHHDGSNYLRHPRSGAQRPVPPDLHCADAQLSGCCPFGRRHLVAVFPARAYSAVSESLALHPQLQPVRCHVLAAVPGASRGDAVVAPDRESVRGLQHSYRGHGHPAGAVVGCLHQVPAGAAAARTHLRLDCQCDDCCHDPGRHRGSTHDVHHIQRPDGTRAICQSDIDPDSLRVHRSAGAAFLLQGSQAEAYGRQQVHGTVHRLSQVGQAQAHLAILPDRSAEAQETDPLHEPGVHR